MYSANDDLKGRVSPFGNLRIKACLSAPRSLSQTTTSFIACNRQGIRHVHLVTCPYNLEGYKLSTLLLCLMSFTTTLSNIFRYRLIKLYFFQIVKERVLLLCLRLRTHKGSGGG